MSVRPYQDSQESKKEQVAQMFDSIAHKYDFLNHFFSLGIDILWRKRAIRMLRGSKSEQILDIATGTGDMAFELMKLEPKKLTGVDISEGMLEIGRQKIRKRQLDERMLFLAGDSENLQFEDGAFDIVTVSFGARNFENLDAGLGEMHRVTAKGGKVCVLEFSQPEYFPLKQLYGFYSRRVMPALGRLISKDKAAYTYLPESVRAFPYGKAFGAHLEQAGYKNVSYRKVTGGIATIYIAEA